MIRKYYEGTPTIIKLSLEIGKLLGIIDASYLRKPTTKLRKENKIKTIQSSLMIEGNSLSLDQVTALFENKRVIGPSKDILEVQNAIKVYADLAEWKAFDQKSYLKAHAILMQGLMEKSGQYRTKGVGIFKGGQVAHMAPPAWNVHHLMTSLFDYLKHNEDSILIKSCVFHYEMEFVHPFMDGNGRMGRLWQTLLLMQENPVFQYLPIESAIQQNQSAYYDVLAASDKSGVCTLFVEYMLQLIHQSLEELITKQSKIMNEDERLSYFKSYWKQKEFSRKDYLSVFKNISSATASRDLKNGVENDFLIKIGDKRNTKYQFK